MEALPLSLFSRLKRLSTIFGGFIIAVGLATAQEPDGEAGDLVDWTLWSDGIQDTARQEEKLMLVSVSHELSPLSEAMRKESYLNADIAKRLNEDFVSVALDKNEFPVIAEYLGVYAWHAKQSRGWPVTAITTADLHPIDGGGYYPPTDDWGSQGLLSLANSVAEQWLERRSTSLDKGGQMLETLESLYGLGSKPSTSFQPRFLSEAAESLASRFDQEYGGFGFAPKMVSFAELRFLDRMIESSPSGNDNWQSMRDKTLDAMLSGAIKDPIRGGFFSSTIEESWTIPDFQKWVSVQADAIDYFSDFPEYQDIVSNTARLLVEEFQKDDGLFAEYIDLGAGSLDEAPAYTWTYDHLSRILNKEELRAFSEQFGATKEGNVPEDLDFTGSFKERNILRSNVASPSDPAISEAKRKLRAVTRKKYPGRQETISSVETNALVTSALSCSGAEFETEAKQLLDRMIAVFWDSGSRKLKAATSENSSEASSKGYALLIKALLDVGEKSGNPKHLELAVALQAVLDRRFGSEAGPYWIGPVDSVQIPINIYALFEDGSGSATSISISNLRRLSDIYPERGYDVKADRILSHLPEEITYASGRYLDLLMAAIGL